MPVSALVVCSVHLLPLVSLEEWTTGPVSSYRKEGGFCLAGWLARWSVVGLTQERNDFSLRHNNTPNSSRCSLRLSSPIIVCAPSSQFPYSLRVGSPVHGRCIQLNYTTGPDGRSLAGLLRLLAVAVALCSLAYSIYVILSLIPPEWALPLSIHLFLPQYRLTRGCCSYPATAATMTTTPTNAEAAPDS